MLVVLIMNQSTDIHFVKHFRFKPLYNIQSEPESVNIQSEPESVKKMWFLLLKVEYKVRYY